MKFFKPEDFTFISPITRIAAAENANTKLESEGKVVYSTANDPLMNSWFGASGISKGGTYKALLLNIEPIKKCVHPLDKVEVILNKRTGIRYYECSCGTEVIPDTFKEKKC